MAASREAVGRLKRLLLVGGAMVAMAGCGSKSGSSGNSGAGTDTLTADSLGLTVTFPDESTNPITVEDDGTLTMQGDCQVTVKSLGKHTINVIENVDPMAKGGDVILSTEDKTNGEERLFYYFEENDAVGLGDLNGGVEVLKNQDGSYDVTTTTDWNAPPDTSKYQHANDGIAAWHIVQNYDQFKQTSPYSLLLVYAAAFEPVRRSRSCVGPQPAPINALMGSNTDRTRGLTGEPPVCNTFQAFCNCAACAATGTKDGDCALCGE